MQEALGIARAQAWTPASRDDNDRAMPILATRFANGPRLSSVGCAFCESNWHIASEQAKTTRDANGVCEASVKEWNAFDTVAVNGKQSCDRINPRDLEDFARWGQARPAYLG
jgi:hypothetical protein